MANYVSRSLKFSAVAGHLLFSAQRFTKKEFCLSSLSTNDVVLVDRYIHSEIAYSVGVHGWYQQWCEKTENGLVEPDILFWLDLDSFSSQKRTQKRTRGSNSEGCETIERINCVFCQFRLNNTSKWKRIAAVQPQEIILQKILDHILENLD